MTFLSLQEFKGCNAANGSGFPGGSFIEDSANQVRRSAARSIILVAITYVGYQMFYVGCPAPIGIELGALIIIPVIYLTLMYLTFVSQE